MITEQQQEQAALYALGILGEEEKTHFATELRQNGELRELLVSLQRTVEKSILPGAVHTPPPSLKEKLLLRIRDRISSNSSEPKVKSTVAPMGLRFLAGNETSGWKPLPVPGAFVKLLSFEPAKGYAVLLGKLDPGVRYPAHKNVGPEDFYILTGDLHVGDQVLGPGDFHHADAGTMHTENFSVEGCTLLAVLTVDDPIVAYAMS